MKGEIVIPEYIARGEKHIVREIRKRSLKDRILIAITVLAGIGVWLSCQMIENGDPQAIFPEVLIMVCTGWIVTFIYAQEREEKE